MYASESLSTHTFPSHLTLALRSCLSSALTSRKCPPSSISLLKVLHVIMRLLYPLLVLAVCSYPCSEVLSLAKDAALVKVREDPPDLSEAYCFLSCISSLISQGYWEPALIVASKAVEAEISLSEELRATVFAAHTEVTKLLNAFDSRPQAPV